MIELELPVRSQAISVRSRLRRVRIHAMWLSAVILTSKRSALRAVFELAMLEASSPVLDAPHQGSPPAARSGPPRTTHRKPTWLMPESIGCAWRAAGR